MKNGAEMVQKRCNFAEPESWNRETVESISAAKIANDRRGNVNSTERWGQKNGVLYFCPDFSV